MLLVLAWSALPHLHGLTVAEDGLLLALDCLILCCIMLIIQRTRLDVLHLYLPPA